MLFAKTKSPTKLFADLAIFIMLLLIVTLAESGEAKRHHCSRSSDSDVDSDSAECSPCCKSDGEFVRRSFLLFKPFKKSTKFILKNYLIKKLIHITFILAISQCTQQQKVSKKHHSHARVSVSNLIR